MKIFVAGLSHKTAPVELRENFAIAAADLQRQSRRLKTRARLSEVVLLSTCNRVEIYGVTNGSNEDLAHAFHHLLGVDADYIPHIYLKQGAAAIEHLFSVTGGMESMVVGETEITGQVKLAYQAAHSAQLTGKVLNRIFQNALQVAKKIRSETGIGRGAVSVGSVAVEMAEKILDRDLSQKTVLIIGAGKMGEACVKHLGKRGAKSVLVSNRSFERAQLLAAEFQGRAIRFDDCLSAMAEADIVISSTGCPQTILHREDVARVMRARRNRPLVLIDIAVPRDIAADVHDLPNVYLYNVDDLEVIIREHVKHRREESSRCQTLIAARAQELMTRLTPSAERDAAITPEPAWGT